MKSNFLAHVLFVPTMMLYGACLEPLESDEVAPAGLLLPAGSVVPSAHDDPVLEERISKYDQVDGVVPLLSAFSAGQTTRYWDFGPAPSFAAPIYRLVKRNEEGALEGISHLGIIGAIPGDPGYSPFWSVFDLEVTDAYNGELITSFAAVDEARALGLVKAPVLTNIGSNCPVVGAGIILEGSEGDVLQDRGYWAGREVSWYSVGLFPLVDGTTMPVSDVYILAKEGRSPVSEPLRGIDITGDGDLLDSNDIFADALFTASYSPLSRRVLVTVSDTAELIDSTLDQGSSSITQASDLFDPKPVAGVVVAIEDTQMLMNYPQHSDSTGN